MKFSFTHKINLANIDRELWPYETEDISISDADSFEEAQQMVDRLVSERIGYYRAKSENAHAKKAAPIPAAPSFPQAGISPAAPVFNQPIQCPATTPAPDVPINPQAGTSSMPPEFNV